MEVAELRKGDRFVLVQPLSGTFGPTEMIMLDMSLAGAKIEHPQALRIGTVGRLYCRHSGDVVVATQAKVLWSHMVKTPKGLVYRSGLQIQPDTSYAQALNALYKGGVLQRDAESLERKRQRMEEREQQRQAAKPRVIPTAGGVQ